MASENRAGSIPLANHHGAPIELSDMQQLKEARQLDDDWTGTVSRTERKKRQNRLNQRALRRRKAQKNGFEYEANSNHNAAIDVMARRATIPGWHTASLSATSPPDLRCRDSSEGLLPATAVAVWNPHDASDLLQISPDTTGPQPPPPSSTKSGVGALLELYQGYQSRAVRKLARTRSLFPLSSDHLITLIQCNVYRGLVQNMLLLDLSSAILADVARTSIWPLALLEAIPPALRPTELQVSVPHAPWIDMFPSARIRDNLIRRTVRGDAERWDEDELCMDLIGEDLEDPALPQGAASPDAGIGHAAAGELASSAPSNNNNNTNDDKDNDNDYTTATAYRTGLILWRDPWDISGWEVTAGFLQKWGWIVEGCEEIIAASNRWRRERGEAELQRAW